MSDKLVELQKAQDNRPKPTDIEFAVQIDAITFHKGINKTAWEEAENKWYEDFKEKFAVYRAELELPVGEWLIKNAKTLCEVVATCETVCGDRCKDCLRNCETFGVEKPKKEWVSVAEIQPRLAKILHDKIVAEEKNREYAIRIEQVKDEKNTKMI